MLNGISSLGIMVILGLAAVADYKTYEIPDRFHVAAVIWWLLFLVLQPEPVWEKLAGGLLGGFAIAGGLLILSFVMDGILGRESLGGGDIKLFFVTGLYLGVAGNLLNLMLSSVLGVVFGLWKRRLGSSEEAIPLAPAIAVSTGICLMMGEGIIGWYLSFF